MYIHIYMHLLFSREFETCSGKLAFAVSRLASLFQALQVSCSTCQWSNPQVRGNCALRAMPTHTVLCPSVLKELNPAAPLPQKRWAPGTPGGQRVSASSLRTSRKAFSQSFSELPNRARSKKPTACFVWSSYSELRKFHGSHCKAGNEHFLVQFITNTIITPTGFLLEDDSKFSAKQSASQASPFYSELWTLCLFDTGKALLSIFISQWLQMLAVWMLHASAFPHPEQRQLPYNSRAA